MKKILAISLSAFLLLSLAGCTNNSEIEQLKKENEELKMKNEELKIKRLYL